METVLSIEPTSAGREHEVDVQQFVQMSALVVVDVATCQQAVNVRSEIKRRQQKIEEFFKPLTEAAYRLHKTLCDRRTAVLAPLAIFDARLQGSIQTWNDQQAAIARAQEREEALKRRREEEARALTEAAALETAALYAPTREEGAAMEAQAAELVTQALAAPAPVVVVPSQAKQVTGLKTRRTWKWRYVGNDPAKAFTRIPREYLCVDESKVNRVVTAMKELTAIPGIEVYYEDVPIR